MRKLLIEVTCDKCERGVSEEAAVNVEFSLSDTPNSVFEIDLCPLCAEAFANGSRLKPKKNRKKKIDSVTVSPQASGAGEYGHRCPGCSRSYDTQRGLQVHQKRAEH